MNESGSDGIEHAGFDCTPHPDAIESRTKLREGRTQFVLRGGDVYAEACRLLQMAVEQPFDPLVHSRAVARPGGLRQPEQRIGDATEGGDHQDRGRPCMARGLDDPEHAVDRRRVDEGRSAELHDYDSHR